MEARNIKGQVLSVVFVTLACVVVWRITLHFSASGAAPQTPPAVTNTGPVPHPPPGAVLVNINMVGFDPAEIPAKVGEPIKLAFFRPNDANCAREVVFPDLGIRRQLPPGETVVVDITPAKTGALRFACGMDMLKGQLMVQ